jgi:hypothetical protein
MSIAAPSLNECEMFVEAIVEFEVKKKLHP